MFPRGPRAQTVEAQRLPDESFDAATLRLQIARADVEELDRKKRQIDLDTAQGKLVTKAEAVDLAQAAVLRCCQLLDLASERLRDRLPPGSVIPDCLDDVLRELRSEMASDA